MAIDYAKKQRSANRAIAKYGFYAILRRTTNSGDTFNPTQTTQDFMVKTVDLGNVVVGENQSENVAVRERQFLLGHNDGVVPQKGDVLVVTSLDLELNYEITRVNTISPGNVNILYELAVKT